MWSAPSYRRVGLLVGLAGLLLASAACEEPATATTVPQPAKPSAKEQPERGAKSPASTAPAGRPASSEPPPPAPPPPPGPPTLAIRSPARAGPVPGDGPGLAEKPGPALDSEPGPARDVWLLPQMPKQVVIRVPDRRSLTGLGLQGPDGLAWPVRTKVSPREAVLVPLQPFAPGRQHRLQVRTRAPSGPESWSIELQVENGVP